MARASHFANLLTDAGSPRGPDQARRRHARADRHQYLHRPVGDQQRRAEFAGSYNLGNGTALNFNGGTLKYRQQHYDITARTVNLGAAGGTVDTGGNNVTFANALGGVGAFTKTGSGTDPSGTNAFAGALNLNGGVLNFANAYNLGGGTAAINFNAVPCSTPPAASTTSPPARPW